MFRVLSSGFHNGFINEKYGIKSLEVVSGVPQISFPLNWEKPPKGTVSFAIVFQDYDNVPDEGFSWLHWLVCDIPSTTDELEENASRADISLIQGRNSWMCPLGSYGLNEDLTDYYGGPAPERDHEYEVQLIALDCFLNLKKGFFYNELRRKMDGHILGEAFLKGIYKI